MESGEVVEVRWVVKIVDSMIFVASVLSRTWEEVGSRVELVAID
jgi:hypothetical protein